MLSIEYLCLLSKLRIMLYQGHGHGEGQHDVTDQDIRPRRSQVLKYGVQPVQSTVRLLAVPRGLLAHGRQFTGPTVHYGIGLRSLLNCCIAHYLPQRLPGATLAPLLYKPAQYVQAAPVQR